MQHPQTHDRRRSLSDSTTSNQELTTESINIENIPDETPDTSPTNPTVKLLPKKFAGLPVRQPAEIRQYKGLCIGMSGRGGVGKTTLSETIVNSPISHNVMFFDVEGGAFVLDDAEDKPGYVPAEGPHLGIVDITEWSHVQLSMQYLIREHKKLGIHGAIWDNCAEVLELCKIKHNFYTTEKSKRLSLWDDITNDMLTFFRDGRNLCRQEQFVMVFVMWDTDRLVDPSDQRSDHKRDIALSPKLAEKFMGIMDYVCWLETPPKPKPAHPPIMHFLDIDPAIPTKKRLNVKQQKMMGIPDVIYNPDLGDIINTVLGGMPWPTDKHTNTPSSKPLAQILQERKANNGTTT